MKKIILILMFSIFFISLTSATINWDPVKQGTCIDLDQSCATCTYVNITMIQYPNDTSTFPDYAMTQRGNKFYYSFCNTTQLGQYHVTLQGDKDGSTATEEGYFDVTPSGEELTESSSFTFNFAMFVIIILFILSLIGLFKFENASGKLACYWISHILFVVGTFSIWKFNESYSTAYSGLYGIFKVLFYVSIIAMFPLVLFSIFWMFYIHFINKDVEKFIERGMDIEEAYRRAKNKRRW